jgi:hypothetical protein
VLSGKHYSRATTKRNDRPQLHGVESFNDPKPVKPTSAGKTGNMAKGCRMRVARQLFRVILAGG